jgi:hypothetical protein
VARQRARLSPMPTLKDQVNRHAFYEFFLAAVVFLTPAGATHLFGNDSD